MSELIAVVRCEQCKNLEMNANSLDDKEDGDDYWCHELERDVFLINYCGLGEEVEKVLRGRENIG